MSRPSIIELNEIKTQEASIQIQVPPTPRTQNQLDNEWSIGCFKLDRRCVMYFFQMTILGCVIAVSLYQVSTLDSNKDFWIGMLSSSIGILIPNPKLSKKD